MDKVLRAGKARALLDDALFNEIFDELEAQAVNSGVYAAVTEDNTRAAAMAEIRAIRALRSKLRTFANEGEANRVNKGSIA